MSLSKKDFHYDLPPELVAHQPLENRAEAKLLVARGGQFINTKVHRLLDYLPQEAVIIRNNSRVIPSRIIGKTKHGGRVEIMLIEPLSHSKTCKWKAIGKPMKKLKPSVDIYFGTTVGTVEEVHSATTPYFTISFPLTWEDFYGFVEDEGFIPLPPYIKREHPLPASQSADTKSYQTVYAGPRGSVAAPTAGLHFTTELCEKLSQQSKIKIVDITLHVGAGTFLPVKTEQLDQHEMHAEKYFIPQDSWQAIYTAYQQKIPIFTVGTTSFRSMESFLSLTTMDQLADKAEQWWSTDLFIYPKTRAERYRSKILAGIMTNFHQPESTLLMLISALVGYDKTKALYQFAIENSYRFYSYGDSSLIFFED